MNSYENGKALLRREDLAESAAGFQKEVFTFIERLPGGKELVEKSERCATSRVEKVKFVNPNGLIFVILFSHCRYKANTFLNFNECIMNTRVVLQTYATNGNKNCAQKSLTHQFEVGCFDRIDGKPKGYFNYYSAGKKRYDYDARHESDSPYVVFAAYTDLNKIRYSNSINYTLQPSA